MKANKLISNQYTEEKQKTFLGSVIIPLLIFPNEHAFKSYHVMKFISISDIYLSVAVDLITIL